MIECLISLLIVVLVAVIVLYVVEFAVGQFIQLPAQVYVLLRLIAGLIVLLYALRCFGVLGAGGPLVRIN